MLKRRYIVVTLQVEGIHSWPECNLPEVKYLKDPHRHIFHIKAIKEVNHNEREIEIIKFKGLINDWLTGNFGFYNTSTAIDFGANSCETIAEILVDEFKLLSCEVLEDGENGAVVQNIPGV